MKIQFEVDMLNPEDDSTLNNMTSTLGHVCGTERLETSIEDARNKKKTIVSKIDSVTNLMKEVEYEEKAAEQTNMEAAQIHSDIMLKVHELMDMQQHVKKKNVMLAGEAYVQKKLLSAKMETLQLHVSSLLDEGDKSLELLDEVSRSLETRLTSAMMKKKFAIKKKKEIEAFARAALAYEEIQMKKVEEESKRLKKEAVKISKLQELLVDRGHLVTILHGEISEKCRDVKRLKDELDHVTEFSEAVIKNSHVVADVTTSIKKVKIKGVSRGYRLFAKCIKKMKIKGKLHGSNMFGKSIKKVHMKRNLHGNKIYIKNIKKLNLKGKRHGKQLCDKSIKKLKIKGIRHGSQMRAKHIKNLKKKVKLHGRQICAKNIKKFKILRKRHGSQTCNFKNLRTKGEIRESRMYVNSIEKEMIKRKRHENRCCSKSVKKTKIEGYKKVKIKGLRVVKKEAAANHRS